MFELVIILNLSVKLPLDSGQGVKYYILRDQG